MWHWTLALLVSTHLFQRRDFVMEVGSSFLSVLLRPGTRPGSKKAWSSATFMMNFTTRLIVFNPNPNPKHGHSLWPSGSFSKLSTRSSSVEESSTRLFRQSKMTSILLVELHGSPLSPSAHPHVLAANACTFYRSDVSQFEKSNSSSESISWLVSSLLSEP